MSVSVQVDSDICPGVTRTHIGCSLQWAGVDNVDVVLFQVETCCQGLFPAQTVQWCIHLTLDDTSYIVIGFSMTDK